MFKRLIFAVATLQLMQSVAPALDDTRIDGVAAQVNSYVITITDVIRSSPELQHALTEMPTDGNKINKLYTEALNRQIDNKLILGSYESQKKFSIPENAFDERENIIIDQAFNGSRSDFLDALAAEHLSEKQWKNNLREKSIIQAMRNMNVDSKVAVSPLAAYEQYQLESDKYTSEPSIKMRMMVVSKGSDEASKAKQKKKMITILKAIKNGDDFGEIAKKYSEDSYSSKGGERGWLKRDMLREDIADAAFSSKVGAVRVVDLGRQYCILKIEDKVEEHRIPYEEARPLIEQELINKCSQKLFNAWIEKLRKDAYIKIVTKELY